MARPIRMSKYRKKVQRPGEITEVWGRGSLVIGEENWKGGTLRATRRKKSKKRGDWGAWKK